jgi:hypothetical protein
MESYNFDMLFLILMVLFSMTSYLINTYWKVDIDLGRYYGTEWSIWLAALVVVCSTRDYLDVKFEELKKSQEDTDNKTL